MKKMFIFVTLVSATLLIQNQIMAKDSEPDTLLENASEEIVDQTNELINLYNLLYFENYSESELLKQEEFHQCIHNLNALYFEYGSFEEIPILPFDIVNVRKGDKLFIDVLAIINTQDESEICIISAEDNTQLLQKCLKNLGYYDGEINDSISMTNEIEKFQKDQNLNITGKVDDNLWRKLDILLKDEIIK